MCWEREDAQGDVAGNVDTVGSYAATFFRGTKLSLVPQDPSMPSYLGSVFQKYELSHTDQTT